MGTMTVGIAEARNDLSAVINRAAYGKEAVILHSRGKPKAAVINYEDYLLFQVWREALAETKTDQLRVLEQARNLRARIQARIGGFLPDSAEELDRLREERIHELSSLH